MKKPLWALQSLESDESPQGRVLLLVPRQGEDPDEDVGEVEEHVDGDVDGVVHRLVETLSHVHVVHHDAAEQYDPDDVQQRDAVVDAEEWQRERDHDQAEQAGEQGRTPSGQVLWHDGADETGQEYDSRRDDERLDDAARLVSTDVGADHDSHGDGADATTEHGDHGVVAGLSQDGTADADGEARQEEEEDQPAAHGLAGEIPVVAELRTERGHADVDGGEEGDCHGERLARDGVSPALTCLVEVSCDTFHVVHVPFVDVYGHTNEQSN